MASLLAHRCFQSPLFCFSPKNPQAYLLLLSVFARRITYNLYKHMLSFVEMRRVSSGNTCNEKSSRLLGDCDKGVYTDVV